MVGERIKTHADLVAETVQKAGPLGQAAIGVHGASTAISKREKMALVHKRLAAGSFPPAPMPGTPWRKWDQTGGSTLITVIGCAVDEEAGEPKAMVFYRSQDGCNYCCTLEWWHEIIILPRGRTRRFEKMVP